MVASSLLASNASVTLGVKCLRHAEMLVPVVTLSCQCTGSDMAIILIFADSMPILCSPRLWQTPGFRHHGRYGLGRVDMSVYSAMRGFRLYMLCVILLSSTWTPDREVLVLRPLVLAVTWSCCSPVKYRITAFFQQMTHCLVSLRCFTLNFTSFYVKAALRFLCAVRTWGSGHYFYGPLFLTVNSSVLLLREECNQEDTLGDDFRIFFRIQPLAWFNSRNSSCVNATKCGSDVPAQVLRAPRRNPLHC